MVSGSQRKTPGAHWLAVGEHSSALLMDANETKTLSHFSCPKRSLQAVPGSFQKPTPSFSCSKDTGSWPGLGSGSRAHSPWAEPCPGSGAGLRAQLNKGTAQQGHSPLLSDWQVPLSSQGSSTLLELSIILMLHSFISVH